VARVAAIARPLLPQEKLVGRWSGHGHACPLFQQEQPVGRTPDRGHGESAVTAGDAGGGEIGLGRAI
jgi:hypothetical protein